MPWLAPEGKTLITVDIGCEVGDAYWTMPREKLTALCLDGISEIFPHLRKKFLGESRILRTPVAYPVFRLQYEQERLRFAAGTGVEGLWSFGRNGEFSHLLMEDVYWRTLRKTAALANWVESTDRSEPTDVAHALSVPCRDFLDTGPGLV
jgi:hypothetical protein